MSVSSLHRGSWLGRYAYTCDVWMIYLLMPVLRLNPFFAKDFSNFYQVVTKGLRDIFMDDILSWLRHFLAHAHPHPINVQGLTTESLSRGRQATKRASLGKPKRFNRHNTRYVRHFSVFGRLLISWIYLTDSDHMTCCARFIRFASHTLQTHLT